MNECCAKNEKYLEKIIEHYNNTVLQFNILTNQYLDLLNKFNKYTWNQEKIDNELKKLHDINFDAKYKLAEMKSMYWDFYQLLSAKQKDLVKHIKGCKSFSKPISKKRNENRDSNKA